jgi:fumarylacetoacetase
MILDLAVLYERGLLHVPATDQRVFHQSSLNAFMALGPSTWREVRSQISRLLRADEPTLRDDQSLRLQVLVPVEQATLLLPAAIGDYTDFYSSREHATNVGSMLRGPDNALMPNWSYLPVAYHGRASSVVVSGTDLCRPHGQSKAETAVAPSFGPSRAIDFELEMGCLIGIGNALGEPIPIEEAWKHVFGLVLVNDWSARDLQKWEYVPLGPFLSKSFGTSISPWVVPLEALEPFRCAAPTQDPTPPAYLLPTERHTYDIHLEVALQSATMNAPQTICVSNFRHL